MSTISDAKFDFSDGFNEILSRVSKFSPEIIKSDSNIARAFAVSRTTPATWRKRGKTPFEAIIDYAKRQKINIHWLLTGEGDFSLDDAVFKNEQAEDSAYAVYLDDDEALSRLNKRAEPKVTDIINKAKQNQRKLLSLKKDDRDLCELAIYELSKNDYFDNEMVEQVIQVMTQENNGLVMIPSYDVHVSAGHGTVNYENETPIHHLAFRQEWLILKGFNKKNLIVLLAKGDSMEPTIVNNNSLLINTAVSIMQDGEIYIIRQEDTLLVKRVQRLLDGNLKLLSDNPTYEPILLSKDSCDSLDVIGQVVWIAKDIT